MTTYIYNNCIYVHAQSNGNTAVIVVPYNIVRDPYRGCTASVQVPYLDKKIRRSEDKTKEG